MCSEPVKLTEVMDKRLLKATPKGRKILIFADNSNCVYVPGMTYYEHWTKLNTVFVASSPMLFGWFESFALQNLQALSKYEVTNVNVHIFVMSSASSCDHFGRHGEWKSNLATKFSTQVANLATSIMQRAGYASTFFLAVQSLSQTNLTTKLFITTISIAYLTYLFELRIPHCSDS